MAERLLTEGHRIEAERLRIAGVEVDLLVRHHDGHQVIVEVKSISSLQWFETRLTSRQLGRLKRAAVAIGGKAGVEIWLALVDPKRPSVQVITDLW